MASDESAPAISSAGDAETVRAPAQSSDPEPGDGNRDWEEFEDKSGKKYWYNNITGEKRYDKLDQDASIGTAIPQEGDVDAAMHVEDIDNRERELIKNREMEIAGMSQSPDGKSSDIDETWVRSVATMSPSAVLSENRHLWETTISVRPTQSARVNPEKESAMSIPASPSWAIKSPGDTQNPEDDSAQQSAAAGATGAAGADDSSEEELDPELHGLSFDELLKLAKKREEQAKIPLCMRPGSKALFLFSEDNTFRVFMIDVAASRVFETTMMAAIFLNVVTLAMALPGEPEDHWANQFSENSQVYFTIIFIIEFLIKVIAAGFVMHPGSYLRDSWNQLDFVIILGGVLAIIIAMLPIPEGPTAYFRILRPFRALKAVNNLEGLRVLVQSVIGALSALGNVLLLAGFVFFIFGVIGVQLFAGSLHGRCYTADTGTFVVDEDRICSMQQTGRLCPSDMVCLEYEDGPQDNIIGFDDIAMATLTIFTAITLEGWTDTMYRLMDAIHPVAAIYMILVVVAGAFFFLNLALAVISTTFQDMMSEVRAKKRLAELELEQKFAHTDELMQHLRGTKLNKFADSDEEEDEDEDVQLPKWEPECAPAGSTPARIIDQCYRIIFERWFGIAIIAAIVANTVVLGIDHYPISDDLFNDLELANKVFTFLFLAEMLLKLTALGPGYVRDPFNIFDGIIVISSLVELVVDGGGALRVLRMMRMFKIMNLSKEWEELSTILTTMYGTLGAIGDFLLLLFLIILIFALLGMQIFGSSYTDDKFPDGVPRANFKDFWQAFMTVYLVVIGENWNEYMYEGIKATNISAAFYFCALVVCGNFVMLNLFLAIFLDGFDSNFQSSAQHLRTVGKWYKERVAALVANADRSPMPPVNSSIVAQALRHGACIAAQEMEANAVGPADRSRRPSRVPSRRSSVIMHALDHSDSSGPQAGSSNGVGVGTGTGAETADRPDSADGRPRARTLETQEDGVAARTLETQEDGVAMREISRSEKRILEERRKRAKRQSIVIQTSSDLLRSQEVLPHEYMWKMMQELVEEQMALGDDELIEDLTEEEAAEAAEKKKQKKEKKDKQEFSPAISPSSRPGTSSTMKVAPLDVETVEAEHELHMSWGEWATLQRYRSQELVEDYRFEGFIISLIGASSVVLAIDHPGVKEGTDLYDHLFIINVVFIAIFTVEMLLKMFAYGVWGYLGDSWNKLDFTVVVSSLVSLMTPQAQLLRALRVLRPLRIMSVNEGMRVIVDAIYKSSTAIFNVLVVCMLFWLIFAIMGVSFFSGGYRFCNGADVAAGEMLVNCTELGGEIIIISQNFDNTIHGLLTVFEISALEIWPDIMFAGIDATGPNSQPSRDNQPWMGAWFMLLVFCSSLFLVNLFVGVVVDNFKRTSEEADGTVYLTPSQRRWLSTQRAVFQEAPQYVMKPPDQLLRAQMFKVVEHKIFNDFIFTMIILNVGFMASTHYRQSDMWTYVLDIANFIFTAIFAAEAAMKITALGWSYFKNDWNKFDFALVIISLVTMLMKSGGNLSLFRIFRVLRVIRLIKSLKGLSSLLTTLILSLPSIANVTSLLLLLIFVYAILGMEFFFEIREGEYMGPHTNFSNFFWSWLTLFRSLTGESWNGIMHDTMKGSSHWAWFFWVTFEILGAFMLLNLFVAIVIDHFEESRKLSGPDCPIEGDDIEGFKVAWAQLDDNADGLIRWDQLEDLLRVLGKLEEAQKSGVVLGLSPKDRRIVFLRKLRYLGNIPVREGMIYFPEVIYYLSKTVLEEHAKVGTTYDKVELPNSKIKKQAEKEYEQTRKMAVRSQAGEHSLGEHWAGTIMVRATRRYLQRKHEREEEDRIRALELAEAEAKAQEAMSRAMAKKAGGVEGGAETENKVDMIAEIGLPPPPGRRNKFIEASS